MPRLLALLQHLATDARKTAVAIVTGAGALIAAGLLHGTVLLIAVGVVAAAGAVGVYGTPNKTAQALSAVRTVAIHVTRLPERPTQNRRTGRHIEHDPRSRAYGVRHRLDPRAPLTSKRWTRRAPIFDQGQIGSCTGNAAIGWRAIDNIDRRGLAGLQEIDALDCYELATQLDNVPGYYKPGDPHSQDTGSSGIGAAKALVKMGYATSYEHAFSLDDFLRTLSQVGAAMVGVKWHAKSFTTTSTGHVLITGAIEGGHEIVFDEIDVERKRVWFDQSWGRWGKAGRGWFTWDDIAKLLDDGGDVTVPIA